MSLHSDALPQRISTGIAGLDSVLGDGLMQHGMYLLEGPPGSGKTILSAQICFHHAHAQRKTLYVTLIAESHGKLLNNLRAFDFYDPALVPERFILMSGYQELKTSGLPGLLQLVARALAEHRPSVLVIDGYRSLRMLAPDAATTAEFIYELNTLITTTKSLCLLLAPRDDSGAWAEKTLMDGVIELHRFSVGMRSVREVEVHKLRSSAPIEGRHAFKICSAGIRVFPRLEASAPFRNAAPDREATRCTFGIEGMDDMLHGGVLRDSATCLLGPPGSGKTIFGLHFLHQGLQAGDTGLHFGFYESPAQLLDKAANLGLDLNEAHRNGQFDILWQPALECRPDELAMQLLENVWQRKARRVVIDGLEGFMQSAVRPERIGRFFNALVGELRRQQVACLYTEEVPLFAREVSHGTLATSAIVDNQILLRFVRHEAGMRRTVAVLKQRESGHDHGVREFWIERGGIRVASDSDSAHAFLAERP
ncbi:MAG TPA: ATPase domain-containing protein [Burkholderiales bacterium]|nr:ATPase domain-containing protein [Burkholderiales bacterium]